MVDHFAPDHSIAEKIRSTLEPANETSDAVLTLADELRFEFVPDSVRKGNDSENLAGGTKIRPQCPIRLDSADSKAAATRTVLASASST